jgi:hypothetical protein
MEQPTRAEVAAVKQVGPATVLLVDDRPENLVALTAVLDDLNLRLVQASSGEEALKELLKEDVALILMDVHMPGLDGFDTVSLIKQRARSQHIPIIFVTAVNVADSYVRRGYAVGAVDYILKPFEPDILRAKVGVFVDLYMQQEQLARLAQQLQEQERFFGELLDNLPVAVAYVDRDLIFRLVNKTAATQRGRLPLDLIGHPLGDDPAAPYVKDVLATGQACAAYTVSVAQTYWDHAFYPVAEGGVLMLGMDVTARVERERQEEQIRSMTKLERLKSEFLSAVSHELRTPLTSVMGYAEFLDDQIGGALTAQQSQFVRRILQGGMRLKTLVDDLLDFATLESGSLELECETFDLALMVADAVGHFQERAEEKGVALAAQTPPEGARGTWDRRRLFQVLEHLLDNALKFTPRGGRVDVAVSLPGDLVLVEVRDTGVGIAAEHLPHLFEKFYQADASLTRSHGGAGLGLSLVKAFVEAHGGQVGVMSEVGQGSRFWFSVPTGPSPSPARPA